MRVGVREWRYTSVTTSTRCETHKPLSRWLTPELQWQRSTSWWKQREDDRDEGVVGISPSVCACVCVIDCREKIFNWILVQINTVSIIMLGH